MEILVKGVSTSESNLIRWSDPRLPRTLMCGGLFVRPLAGNIVSLFLFCVIASPSLAQDSQPGPEQSRAPVSSIPGFVLKNYLPACSTEKVNGDCVF